MGGRVKGEVEEKKGQKGRGGNVNRIEIVQMGEVDRGRTCSTASYHT